MILRRFLALLLLVCAISLLIGVITFYLRTTNPSKQVVQTPSFTVTWDTSSGSFTQPDRQDIEALLQSTLSKPTSKYSGPLGHVFSIIQAQRQAAWATFSVEERESQNSTVIPSEPLFFIAHFQSLVWSIWLPGSSQFCKEIKLVPDTLVVPLEKEYISSDNFC